MKKLFTLLTLCFTIGLFAQNDVTVKINHKFGTDDFAMNSAVTCYDNYNLKVTRLQYYLNNFIITHDGGMVTETTEHFLINSNNLAELNLGSFDITSVENISFSVGVHPDRNHLDPSSYASTHPLAPQNPSMHWGWTAGYRFIALEGKAGANVNTTYEIHALGDQNYKTVSMPIEGNLDGTSLTISIDADYLGMFNNGLNVSNGVITHGETGNAVKLLNNFETEVFFPEGEVPVETIDPTFEGKFSIQPNPSFDKNTNVVLNLPTADNYQLTLTDLTGRVIRTQQVSSGEQNIELTSNHPGAFFIHLWKDGEPVAFEKWIVK
jgi:hypothetical protein